MRRNMDKAEQSAFYIREKVRRVKKPDEVEGLGTVLDIVTIKYILVG
jgi:hypothetical protein